MVIMTSAGMAWAGKDVPIHHPVKQTAAATATQSAATQAWAGASLQTEVNPDMPAGLTRKQAQRKQLNLQYTSKRPYMDAQASD